MAFDPGRPSLSEVEGTGPERSRSSHRATQPSSHPATPHGCRIWLAVGIAAFLTVAINIWVRYSELVTGRYVVGGAPQVPTVAFLLTAVPLTLTARRLGRFGLDRSEILIIYSFLTVSIFMTTFGVARAFFPCLTVPFYFATPENRFASYWEFIPRWFVPRDPELIRLSYEGSAPGVPWHAWLPYIFLWLCFFLVVFLTLLFLIVLFRRPWVENERLSFPLLYLPLEMTAGLGGGSADDGTLRNLFINPLMWVGFTIASLFHALNILNAFNPSIPAAGAYVNIGQLFTERPWNAVQPLSIFYQFETVGFGYLVPLEILFSLWFFYLLEKVVAVLGRAIGYEPAGFPYQHEQSAGAYIALALILVWLARSHIREIFFRSRTPPPYAERTSTLERIAGPGFLIGFCAIVGFGWAAGMSPVLALLFFGLVVIFAFVSARVRAEAGLPILWPFPYDQQKEIIVNTFGSPLLTRWFGMQSLTLMSLFFFLSRHYFPSVTQYQIDNLRLTDEARVPRRTMAKVMVFALMLGLTCAFVIHLSAYYEFGENLLEGNPLTGGYRSRVALQEFTRTFTFPETPLPASTERTVAYAFGFLSTIALASIRFRLLKFPLSPLGFAVANAYGAMTPYWAPFFLVWLLKSIILKWGGAPLYKKFVPFFLGLVIGQYFTTGIVWTTMSVFINPEISARFHLSIGG